MRKHQINLCPQARIVVTAGSPSQVLELYEGGADRVLRPNFLTAKHLLEVMDLLLGREVRELAEKEIHRLSQQREVLG